jgi:N-acetylmuramoyl-L-alanine amidase
MINPAGDARQTGRIIDGYFERGITLQFFDALKDALKQQYLEQPIRLISTRFPGETIQELQNANFANRLNVDLYISIHFYHETQTKPNLFLYTFSYRDNFIIKKTDLTICPYDKAYLINADKTNAYSTVIKQILSSPAYSNKCTVHDIFAFPFEPLIGIVAPAIGIEIGLKNKDDWKQYIDPLVQAIIILTAMLR